MGVNIGDVGGDISGTIAGGDVYMTKAAGLIRDSDLPLPHKAELVQDLQALNKELESDEPSEDVLNSILSTAERILPALVPVITELIQSTIR